VLKASGRHVASRIFGGGIGILGGQRKNKAAAYATVHIVK